MAKNEDKIDLFKLVCEASPEESEKILAFMNAKKEEADMKKALSPKTLIKISDFNDKRVKPFGVEGKNPNEEQCIYEVFNKKQKTKQTMRGDQIICFFSEDDEKNAFRNKSYGGTHNIKEFNIRFLYYEMLV